MYKSKVNVLLVTEGQYNLFRLIEFMKESGWAVNSVTHGIREMICERLKLCLCISWSNKSVVYIVQYDENRKLLG